MGIDLPVIWAVIIGFVLMMYVVMDGFDLGIGILFPFIRDRGDRDTTVGDGGQRTRRSPALTFRLRWMFALRLGGFRHQHQHVSDAWAKDGHIHDDEHDERYRKFERRVVRYRVLRPHHAIDHPGLAPDLRG